MRTPYFRETSVTAEAVTRMMTSKGYSSSTCGFGPARRCHRGRVYALARSVFWVRRPRHHKRRSVIANQPDFFALFSHYTQSANAPNVNPSSCAQVMADVLNTGFRLKRSEERRVGKECRSRGWRCD